LIFSSNTITTNISAQINDSMEFMINTFLLLSLISVLLALIAILFLFLIVIRLIVKYFTEDTLTNWQLTDFIPKEKATNPSSQKNINNQMEVDEEVVEQNRYTPELVENQQVPLDQFTPNFNQPLKVKLEDDGENHGLSVEEEPTDAR